MPGLLSAFPMAPMAGVTDAPFRWRLRRNGCRLLFTEMVSAAALARGNRRTLEYLQPPDLGPDLGVQLFGAEPEELALAAHAAQGAGFAHVDLNMGCPVRKVVRSGAGAALLLDLGRAERCLRAMRREVSGLLSVKIRTGWDAGSVNALEVGRLAVDCGVDIVAVHGRTRAQGYGGRADWDVIGELAAALPVPVLGNGDIASADDAVQRLRGSGVAGVMIGRVALSCPWIFRDAERLLRGETPRGAPGPMEIGDDLLRQIDDLESVKGAKVALLESRKFVAWASRGFSGATEFRRRVQEIRNLSQFRRDVEGFFSEAYPREVAVEAREPTKGGEWDERQGEPA
ncbi:MAG: tRNA-dihydrouridine synthase [Deltaproteobacteria bacterium]|nr:tRNA-dihydrouridine synthase [Deltaproteobacteria bacterium]